MDLELLHAKKGHFKTNAHIIVPLSRKDFDLEQDYKVLQYKGDGTFDEVENIMRTSFAERICVESMEDASLDVDYFNNMTRLSKLHRFEEKIKT